MKMTYSKQNETVLVEKLYGRKSDVKPDISTFIAFETKIFFKEWHWHLNIHAEAP